MTFNSKTVKSLRVRYSWWRDGIVQCVAWLFWWRHMNAQFCMRPTHDKLGYCYFESFVQCTSSPTTQTQTLSMALSQAMPSDVKSCLARRIVWTVLCQLPGSFPTMVAGLLIHINIVYAKELLHYLRHICGTRRDPSGFNQPRHNFRYLFVMWMYWYC